jgi:acetylornithine deacetylase/succinyl-diaminopimelate desuccinylase-like protein
VGGRLEHLDEFVRGQKHLLAADVVVISDGAMFDDGVPSLCCGLRGLAYFQLDLRGTSSDLHSGSFGGAVANPALVLAQMLAQMKDESGRIRIPGFYDDVRPLTDEERAQLATLPFDENKYREKLGAPRLFGEAGYTTLERVWTRPTLDVNGLLAGFTGEGAKTVIPAVAMAKLSMRFVLDQDADKIGDLFEAYVNDVAPETVEVTVTRMYGGKFWTTTAEHQFVRAAARAIEAGFGARPAFTREGGSNAIVPTFQEVLDSPIVLFELGLPDDNPHAPNERLDVTQFHHGVIAAAHLYEEIARSRSQ